MTHRLAANYAKNYCNRTPIIKVIVENVVTCFWGDMHSVLFREFRKVKEKLKGSNIDTAYHQYSVLIRYDRRV